MICALFILVGCSQKEVSYTQTNQDTKPYDFEKPDETLFQKAAKIEQEKEFEIITEQKIKDSIAIVFPSQIVGKYANGAINTVISYLIFKEVDFNIEVIDSYDESFENINQSVTQILNKDYTKAIFLFTQESLHKIARIDNIEQLMIYMPLVHAKDAHGQLDNITYGGIDYKQQFDVLQQYSNGNNRTLFSDSILGHSLNELLMQSLNEVILATRINNNSNNYKSIALNKNLNNATLFLNTSIIQTSILLSQLRAHETMPYTMLSTQLNYNPLIVSLTQYEDRKQFFIANSIQPVAPKLEEISSLLDADIVYNWVNYSTLIGIDYLLGNGQITPNQIENKQVKYSTFIYQNTPYGFKKHNTN
jgi:hypothetical protein